MTIIYSVGFNCLFMMQFVDVYRSALTLNPRQKVNNIDFLVTVAPV